MEWKLNKYDQQIKKEVGIFSVINEYLILHKKNKNFVAICPFHDDKNPSLVISELKQFFKCFSCGTSGTAIKFVILYEKVSFLNAYKIIVKKFKLKIDPDLIEESKITEEQKSKLEILSEIHNYYRMKLLDPSSRLKTFLNKRNINFEIIKKYELGWAPENEKEIIIFLFKKGFTEKELLKSELFIIKNDQLVDYFRSRLLFPLKNENYNLVGFSGRTIASNNNYFKYLISHNSNIFDKKKILFNLTYVLNNFKNFKKIYLVEGFMDAIRLTELNYPAIAILGTEIYYEQISLIKSLFEEVVIFPDGDKPGIKSSINNSLKLIKLKINTFIFDIPTNLDPDDLLQKDPNILEKNKDKIVHPIDFIISKYKKKELNEELNEIILKIIEFLKFMSNIKKNIWIKKIQKELNISGEILREKLMINNLYIEKKIEKEEENDENKINNEEVLLFCLFFLKKVRNEFYKNDFKFENKLNKEIYKFIIELFEKKENFKINENLSKLTNNKLKNKIIFLLKNKFLKSILKYDEEKQNDSLNVLFNWFKNRKIQKKLTILKKKIKKIEDIDIFIEYKEELLKKKKNIIFFK